MVILLLSLFLQNYVHARDGGGERNQGQNSPIRCPANQHYESNQCVADVRECAIRNGEGQQVWDGREWGSCIPTACDKGFEPDERGCVASNDSLPTLPDELVVPPVNGQCPRHFHIVSKTKCVFNFRECEYKNGYALQQWSNDQWGVCELQKCDSGFEAIPYKSGREICTRYDAPTMKVQFTLIRTDDGAGPGFCTADHMERLLAVMAELSKGVVIFESTAINNENNTKLYNSNDYNQYLRLKRAPGVYSVQVAPRVGKSTAGLGWLPGGVAPAAAVVCTKGLEYMGKVTLHELGHNAGLSHGKDTPTGKAHTDNFYRLFPEVLTRYVDTVSSYNPKPIIRSPAGISNSPRARETNNNR